MGCASSKSGSSSHDKISKQDINQFSEKQDTEEQEVKSQDIHQKTNDSQSQQNENNSQVNPELNDKTKKFLENQSKIQNSRASHYIGPNEYIDPQTQKLINDRRESILNERKEANKLGLSRSKYDEYLKYLQDNNLDNTDDNLKIFLRQSKEQYQTSLNRRQSAIPPPMKPLDGLQEKQKRTQSVDYLGTPILPIVQKSPQKLEDVKNKNSEETLSFRNRLSIKAKQPVQIPQKPRKSSDYIEKPKNTFPEMEEEQMNDEFLDMVEKFDLKEKQIRQRHQILTPNFNLKNNDYVQELADSGIGYELALVWNQLTQKDKAESLKRKSINKFLSAVNQDQANFERLRNADGIENKDNVQSNLPPLLQNRRRSHDPNMLLRPIGQNKNHMKQRRSLFAQQ